MDTNEFLNLAQKLNELIKQDPQAFKEYLLKNQDSLDDFKFIVKTIDEITSKNV
ncbi:hypothetical protein AVANS14531_09075 [Campylobacter sp. Cr9]|uniref:hypothetical protein n=1 Tax=Campylobacter sp. Cr9 TaxID=2735728 RepID=UPI0030143CA3|nr:hypothetical protein [Campylobacter sp. Cr9]